MKALVCGGRFYANKERLFTVMDKLHEEHGISAVIHGCAKGADFLASLWAQERGIKEERYPADWGQYGKSAGFIRNREMLEKGKPNLVVALPRREGHSDDEEDRGRSRS